MSKDSLINENVTNTRLRAHPVRRMLILVFAYIIVVVLIILFLGNIIFSLGYLSLLLVPLLSIMPSGPTASCVALLSAILVIVVLQVIISGKKPGWLEKFMMTICVVVMTYSIFPLGGALFGGALMKLYELAFFLVIALGVFSLLLFADVTDRRTFHIRLVIIILLGFGTAVASFFGPVKDQIDYQNELKKVDATVSIIDCKQFKFTNTWKSCIYKHFVSVSDHNGCVTASKYDSDRAYCNQRLDVTKDAASAELSSSITACNNLITVEGSAKCLLKNLQMQKDFEYCSTEIRIKGYSGIDATDCYAVYAFRTNDVSVCAQNHEGSGYVTECQNRFQRLQSNDPKWFITVYK